MAMDWKTEEMRFKEFKTWFGQQFSLLYIVQTGSGVHTTS
jgi:hypothetical protein